MTSCTDVAECCDVSPVQVVDSSLVLKAPHGNSMNLAVWARWSEIV